MFLLIESRFLYKNFDFLKNKFLITYMRKKKEPRRVPDYYKAIA